MGNVIFIRRDAADAPFEAHQDSLHAEGPTLGTALDSLLSLLGEVNEPLLLIQQDKPDHFFTLQDHDRLQELQARAKGNGSPLTPQEEEELHALIAKEFRATIERTEPLLQQRSLSNAA
ncbi:MAG: hypothetical protein QM758_03345 [Armatimonas sp.]